MGLLWFWIHDCEVQSALLSKASRPGQSWLLQSRRSRTGKHIAQGAAVKSKLGNGQKQRKDCV